MKRLLRSIIDIGGGISQENLVINFTKLMNARVEWGRDDDDRIYKFIFQFFQSQLEMPSIQTVRDYFERVDDTEVTHRLEVIEAAIPYIRTNFSHLLTQILEEQNKIKAVALLKESHDIIARGLEIDGQRKFGIRDALMHFSGKAHEILTPSFNSRFRGDVRRDGEEMRAEYITAKNNRDKVLGKFTGLKKFDEVCKGVKRGELWIHGAFPGELKTTFAANWCYNLVTHYKTNVLYISMEMPYDQVRRNIYTLHAANRKWEAKGMKPLDYRKIRDGELPPDEELHYLDSVIPDFNENPNYCHFEVINPERDMTMADIRMEAELLHKQMDVGFVVIDHGQWVEPEKGKKNRDYTVELNTIVRDAKRFALRFNNNEGIPVLLLWQINREGKEEADKRENDGQYKLKAFTYANEVEKTGDVITTTYLNDTLRGLGRTKICNLKNRDNPPVKPFEAAIDFSARRLYDVDNSTSESGMGVSDMLGNLHV